MSKNELALSPISELNFVNRTGMEYVAKHSSRRGLVMIDKLPLESAKEIGRAIVDLSEFNQFATGDWVNKCIELYGNAFNPVLSEIFGTDKRIVEYVQMYAAVCRAFPIKTRTYNLTFSHYYEVHRLPFDRACQILAWSEENRSSCADVRAYVKTERGGAAKSAPSNTPRFTSEQDDSTNGGDTAPQIKVGDEVVTVIPGEEAQTFSTDIDNSAIDNDPKTGDMRALLDSLSQNSDLDNDPETVAQHYAPEVNVVENLPANIATPESDDNDNGDLVSRAFEDLVNYFDRDSLMSLYHMLYAHLFKVDTSLVYEVTQQGIETVTPELITNVVTTAVTEVEPVTKAKKTKKDKPVDIETQPMELEPADELPVRSLDEEIENQADAHVSYEDMASILDESVDSE